MPTKLRETVTPKSALQAILRTSKPHDDNRTVDGFSLIENPDSCKTNRTIALFQSDKDHKIFLIGILGTRFNNTADVNSYPNLYYTTLKSSRRFKNDKNCVQGIVDEIRQECPDADIYLAAHSLGAAIATELLRDVKGLKSAHAIEFNGAFQHKDIYPSASQENTDSTLDIQRFYTDKDFLLKLGGQALRKTNIKVVVVPKGGIAAHKVDAFKDFFRVQKVEPKKRSFCTIS